MPNSLDALCRRFEVDLTARTTHNALLDCKLLADVYVELTGGRQRGLTLETEQALSFAQYEAPASRVVRLIEPSTEQKAAHGEFIAKMKDPVWLKE
jgi:DNA polymerase-3 subunit epsilon